MGDDIGMWNIGAYHRGLMAGKTPNIDQIAKEGMLFTDYYAEASCTAGRANFITGELPIRTGMTTVGQAGASVGLPAEAVTIATILKSMGYASGQFGKRTTPVPVGEACEPCLLWEMKSWPFSG
jgi:arylsulfatase